MHKSFWTVLGQCHPECSYRHRDSCATSDAGVEAAGQALAANRAHWHVSAREFVRTNLLQSSRPHANGYSVVFVSIYRLILLLLISSTNTSRKHPVKNRCE